MRPEYTPQIRQNISHLRANQTDAETWLWKVVRGQKFAGFKFRRQVPIGPFIVDFYCHRKKLVIELDGGQHNLPDDRMRDEERTKYLESRGLRVLRFWNNDVFQQKEAVLSKMWEVLNCVDPPSPDFCEQKSPSPARTRERGFGAEAG